MVGILNSLTVVIYDPFLNVRTPELSDRPPFPKLGLNVFQTEVFIVLPLKLSTSDCPHPT
jgi:hypothetical protein